MAVFYVVGFLGLVKPQSQCYAISCQVCSAVYIFWILESRRGGVVNAEGRKAGRVEQYCERLTSGWQVGTVVMLCHILVTAQDYDMKLSLMHCLHCLLLQV